MNNKEQTQSASDWFQDWDALQIAWAEEDEMETEIGGTGGDGNPEFVAEESPKQVDQAEMIGVLRHCRMFIVEKRGYSEDEAREREILKERIDKFLKENS